MSWNRSLIRFGAVLAALVLGPRCAIAQLPEPIATDPDGDGDGLSDFQERHKYGTDPMQADSDGDGTPDGDWDERREYAYTVRTVVRVVKPVDVAAATDDFQDARLREEHEGWVELEVIHYPLGTANEAIVADPEWRKTVERYAPYLASTATSSWNEPMREALLEELRDGGLDALSADDRTLAVAAARRLMDRSKFEDGFTSFLADFEDGEPIVPPGLEEVVREYERKHGLTIEEQWERELLAEGMFEHRVHGSCTSSAIYLCGGLRAAGIPARIVLLIPLVDGNDEAQLELVAKGIRHHRVRETALKGLRRIRGSWASHTFNEVLVGGRWRRLNYTRLGQPILDEGLYGMTTHVLTVVDWADAHMGRTVGRRQALQLRDEVFPTPNPYATLEVSDEFGEHANVSNPPYEPDAPPEEVTLVDAFWLASSERPAHLDVSRVDLATDRLHVALAARTTGLTLEREVLDPFWQAVPRGFRLVSDEHGSVPATAVRGMWYGKKDGLPYLYFLLRLEPEARERLVEGAPYRIEPDEVESGARFRAAKGLSVVAPE